MEALSSDATPEARAQSHPHPSGTQRPYSEAEPWWRCRYRHSRCPNPRATKIDGSLHQLCQAHRLRANLNQRRSHERRRARVASLAPQEEHSRFDDAESSAVNTEEVSFHMLPIEDLQHLLDVLESLSDDEGEAAQRSARH